MKTRALGASGYEVGAVGLGCMYLSIDGRPADADAARTVHAALDAGVTLLDTADVYCLNHRDIGHNERIIARALHERSRSGVVVATKGGLERPSGAWTRNARPDALRRARERSLKALGVSRIDLYQLHAPDPAVPFSDSVGELARLRTEGKIAHIGLSNVSVPELEVAAGIVPIVSVQNRWNPLHRAPEADGILARCTELGVALLPYSPFGGAGGAKSLGKVGTLAAEARRFGVSPHRLVVAWMLAKSPVVIPIPGARRAQSIEDCAAASDLALTTDDVARVERAFR